MLTLYTSFVLAITVQHCIVQYNTGLTELPSTVHDKMLIILNEGRLPDLAMIWQQMKQNINTLLSSLCIFHVSTTVNTNEQ
jgi:hypothetical protein